MTDTIFALATGSLACAVSIIRVSGPRAADIGTRFCGIALRAREARYVQVRDPGDGELIDSGLVLFFKGPASFTGDDCLEFQLHGSRAVVSRMLHALGRETGCRMAQPGEFIRRAFDHGKLPLTSVEGVADLIDARTDLQRRQALAQASGMLAGKAAGWRDMLLEALALITAEIDFADEGEAPTSVISEVKSIAARLGAELQDASRDAARGALIRNGFRVVLCGPPNAGKSSLLNALAQRDVAIVTEHAGTTRDLIEVELDLGGVSIVLTDTAGLRDTRDAVEALGVERSRRAMAGADLIIWLTEAAMPSAGDVPDGALVIATKMDVAPGLPAWADLGISTLRGDGLTELIQRIQSIAARASAGEMPLVTNARQHACVELAARHLERLVADDFSALELVAEDLLRCCDVLQELVGRMGAEDVLGAVFSRFCMGK